jgi:hypothetical protein
LWASITHIAATFVQTFLKTLVILTYIADIYTYIYIYRFTLYIYICI